MSSGIMQANVNQLALRNRSGAVARDEAQVASSAFEANAAPRAAGAAQTDGV